MIRGKRDHTRTWHNIPFSIGPLRFGRAVISKALYRVVNTCQNALTISLIPTVWIESIVHRLTSTSTPIMLSVGYTGCVQRTDIIDSNLAGKLFED